MILREIKQGMKLYDLDHLERGVGIVRNILTNYYYSVQRGEYTPAVIKINFLRNGMKGIYYTIGYSKLDSLVDEITYLKYVKK